MWCTASDRIIKKKNQEDITMETTAKLYNDVTKILVGRDEIQKAVKELGEKITRDYQGKDLVMVCILKGASVFFSDLIRDVDLPVTLDFMALSSYRNSTKSSGVVNLEKDLSVSIKGRDVLIVEDIVDSGNTLFYLSKYLKGRGASSIRIATLLDKPERRNPEINLTVDYHCFEIPDEFVVGYGLDFAEKYRNLPDIGVLNSRVYGAAHE